MLLDSIFVISGLILLFLGAEALIRGSCWLALKWKITPAVIGLTVVAAGTSMPEMVVSLQAAFSGNNGLSIGNIVGSNIFNMAVILGLAAIIKPLIIQENTFKIDWPIMFGATILMFLFCLDRQISRLEGTLFFSSLITYITYSIYQSRKENENNVEEPASIPTASFGFTGYKESFLNIGSLIFGIGALAFGARILVEGSVNIAMVLGISETVVGLTIVAAGTSMPELITSIVASYRKCDDIAVANIIGSNIFNILGIIGLTALISPLSVPLEIVNRDNYWLGGVSLLLLPLMVSGRRLCRLEGVLLFATYVMYSYIMFKY